MLLSRRLIRAHHNGQVAKPIVQLDVLLPWLDTKPQHRSLSGPSASESQQPARLSAPDKNGESSTQSSTLDVSKSDSRSGQRRTTKPASQTATSTRPLSLSEEVASLSSSLSGLLGPWEQHPSPHLLPGVDLPSPFENRSSQASTQAISIDSGESSTSSVANPSRGRRKATPNPTLRGKWRDRLDRLDRDSVTNLEEGSLASRSGSLDGTALGIENLASQTRLSRLDRQKKGITARNPSKSRRRSRSNSLKNMAIEREWIADGVRAARTAGKDPFTGNVPWQIAAMEETLRDPQMLQMSQSETLRPRSGPSPLPNRARRSGAAQKGRGSRRLDRTKDRDKIIHDLRLVRRRRSLSALGPDKPSDSDPVSGSFIKHQLQYANPPSPRRILRHLRARPELLNSRDAKILVEYATRVQDHETAFEVKRAMYIFNQTLHTKRNYRSIVRANQYAGSPTAQVVRSALRRTRRRLRAALGRVGDVESTASDVKAEVSRRRDDPHGSEYPARRTTPYWFLCLHPWAEANMPLRSILPSHPSIEQRLGYLHYVLVTSDFRPATLTQPIEYLGVTTTKPVTAFASKASGASGPVGASTAAGVETHPPKTSLARWSDTWFTQADYRSPLLVSLDGIARACSAAAKRQQGTRQSMLLVLHLYMIYANRVDEYRTPRAVPDGCRTVLYDKLSQPYQVVWLFEEYVRLHGKLRPSRQTLHLMLQRILFGTPSRDFSVKLEDLPQRGTTVQSDFKYPYHLPAKPHPEESSRLISDVRIILDLFKNRWVIYAGPETIRLMSSYALQVNSVDLAKNCWDMWWHEMARPVGREPRWEGDHPRWDHRQKHTSNWWEILQSMKRKGWVETSDIGDLPPPVEDRLPQALNGQSEAEYRANSSSRIETRAVPEIWRLKLPDGQVWQGHRERAQSWRWLGRQKLDQGEGIDSEIDAPTGSLDEGSRPYDTSQDLSTLPKAVDGPLRENRPEYGPVDEEEIEERIKARG